MEIAVLLVLIVLNGGFAMSEMALITSRKGRLQNSPTRVIAARRQPLN